MTSWLRDFTDMPLGVYPNLGHLTRGLWRFDDRIDPEAYARLALEWRDEGAQIIGGCCGVTPEHIAAAAAALDGTTPDTGASPRGRHRRRQLAGRGRRLARHRRDARSTRCRFPISPSSQASSFRRRGATCSGSTSNAPASERAAHASTSAAAAGSSPSSWRSTARAAVHAIDIDRGSVANTLANAFRNDVAGLVTGETIDLFQWEPTERFDVIAASLYQMPVDPYEEPSGHRPLDFWGRNLFDRFLGLLPDLLAPGGRALVLQLSILGQVRTAQLLAAHGLEARVVDYSFFPFGEVFEANAEQIARVEELSDAHHLAVGGDNVMIAYLLEIERAGRSSRRGRPRQSNAA